MEQALAKTGAKDIVRDGAFDLTPHSLSEALQLAEMMSKSELVPQNFRGRPADVLIAVQYGAEIGLKPLQALSGIAVINGRACVWGDALLALVLDSGLMTNYKEMNFEEIEAAGKAVFWCTRRGQSEPIEREFSIKDAQKAGLWNGKDTWKKYPYRMLQMRARAFALRDGFSDVLKGLSVREEIEDITVQEAPKVLAVPRRLSERSQDITPVAEGSPALINAGAVTGDPPQIDPASDAPARGISAQASEYIKYITEPQRKRLFAIAMQAVGDKDKVKSLLAEMKIEHTSQIKQSDYEDICAFFESYHK